ncbi:MAG: hypothetical protein NC548_26880 [Lachnospiraceae bacterium]|nr:hypothetical protein [Lachnospiraceae bacterium]
MARFKPALPYTVPLILLIPDYQTVKGVATKLYPDAAEGIRFNGSFKTYGGTETNQNGMYSVLDTANIETWYRPDIKGDCRVALAQTGAVYEVIGEPENVNMRNQYMKFKVQRVKGGG